MRKLFLALALTLCAAGCGSVRYDDLGIGHFSGRLFVMWVDKDKFVFVPDPNDKLTFIRPGSPEHARVIIPEMMYTDGGSIPRIAQIFKGFSPWGYAPAYMIHDWLFVSRHCLRDNDPDPRYQAMKGVTFDESAAILGEAIKTLIAQRKVRDDDRAGSTITLAVDSFVAKKLWDQDDACADTKVSDKDRLEAEAAIPGSAENLRRRAKGRAFAAPAASRAKVITVLDF